MRADKYARDEAPQVKAIVVVRHGWVVFERYYDGFGPGSYFSVASITKSVLSALTGIALRDCLLSSADQPIGEFFPGDDTHGLTLRQLLSLTAGWPYREFAHRHRSVADMLREPLTSLPGERFQYGETPPHLVSAILTQLTGMSAMDFARRELFEPLGMWRDAVGWREARGTWHEVSQWPASGLPWVCDAEGISTGGFGLHLTPRDMARFGLLYASDGQWDGQQLLPAGWAAECARPHSRGGSPMWMPYGLSWWLPVWHRYGAMWGAGYGGQELYVNLALDLVIAVACKLRPEDPTSGGIVTRYLLPAVVDW